MLFPTSGSRIFIGVPVGDGAPDWIEIREVEALGAFGVEWRVAEIEMYDGDPSETGWVEYDKQSLAAPAIQLVFGLDPADPGQRRLWEAARSVDEYRFRIDLSAGERRLFAASVTGLSEVYDVANSVMKLQADLHPVVSSLAKEAM